MEFVQHNPHSFCLEYCHHGNNIFLRKQKDNVFNDLLIKIQDSYEKLKVKLKNFFGGNNTFKNISSNSGN